MTRKSRGRGPSAAVLTMLAVLAGTIAGGACGGSDSRKSAHPRRATTSSVARSARGSSVALDTRFTLRGHAVRMVDAHDGPFPTFDDSGGFGRYTGDTYKIGTKPANSKTVAGFGQDDLGTDTKVTAWFDSHDAPADAGFGVVCRLSNDGRDYYKFGVGNDGTYAITRVIDDEATILTGDGQWIHHDGLEVPPPLSIVEATCHGADLTLSVNYDEIDRVTDDALAEGAPGVFLQTFDQANAAVAVSTFEAVGYQDRRQVSDAEAESWEAFWHSNHRLDDCRLGDPHDPQITPLPRFFTSCGTATFTQMSTADGTVAGYRALLDQAPAKFRTVRRAPDCRRDSGVASAPAARPPPGDPTVGVACLRTTLKGRPVVAVFWAAPGPDIVGVKVVDPGDPDFVENFGTGWWPFLVQIQPG